MLFLRKIAIFALRITGRRVGDGPGEMPEWSIGPHSKCGVRATVPGVRIPLSPPVFLTAYELDMEKYPSGRRGSPAKGVV